MFEKCKVHISNPILRFVRLIIFLRNIEQGPLEGHGFLKEKLHQNNIKFGH
jgi:hypothetical protein